jgi:hypothetical protein
MARYTRERWAITTVRLPVADRERWFAASKLTGISQAQFLREALHAHAVRVFAHAGRKQRRDDRTASWGSLSYSPASPAPGIPEASPTP